MLPIALASMLLLLASRPIQPRDVYLNLATDLVTIIITVLYVDWVLSQHEHATWFGVDQYIASEAGRAGHAFIASIAEVLKLEDRLYPRYEKQSVAEIQQAILQNARSLDRLAIEDSLASLSALGWQHLMTVVGTRRMEISPLISQFGSRMDPPQLEALLAFREVISTILSTYSVFEAFLGVPPQDMPKVKDGKPEEFAILTIIRLGVELKAAFEHAIALVDLFQYKVPPERDCAEETKISWNRWYERSLRRHDRAR